MKSLTKTGKIDALSTYLRGLKYCPPLTREEEVVLALRYRDSGDSDCAHRLVRANLRAVVKVAGRYRHSGVGLLELIQEGNLGLLQAVIRFDPTRGVRLVTYASWWIRAYMQRYLQSRHTPHGYASISEPINVDDKMDGTRAKRRVSISVPIREVYLDQPVNGDSSTPLSSLIPDESPDQESSYLDHESAAMRKKWVNDCLRGLDPQERQVIVGRYLRERPGTLKEIGEELGLSRQRIHQIELKARRKLGSALREQSSAMMA